MQKVKCLALIRLSILFTGAVHAGVDCARIDWHSRETGRDGVSHSATWQERICVDTDTLWRERLNVKPAHHDADKHEHPDLNIASQWLQKSAIGASARLIFSTQKWRVALTPAEYDLIGFDGRMPSIAVWLGLPLDAKAGVSSARHIGATRWEWQWPAQARFPHAFSARRTQGNYELSATLHPEPVRAAPWLAVRDYQVREWSDWSD